MLYCPDPAPEADLIAGHAYLFKKAEGWRSQQAWSEYIASKVGSIARLDVPRCFIAVNTQTGHMGALVEFFYNYPSDVERERLVHGADLLNRMAGDRQVIRTNVRLCAGMGLSDATEWWGETLTFDALIGNTDRHTQNWGVLVTSRRGAAPIHRFAPVFDNGTSLGFQQKEERIARAWTDQELRAFIARGRHHCGWSIRDRDEAPHIELCRRFARSYSRAGARMRDVIRFATDDLRSEVYSCCGATAPVPFTEERARFVISQIETRRELLSEALGK